MGSCCSSGGWAAEEYGEERRVRRVWPSDDDGGEWLWDINSRASTYIDKFHRHQSGVVCTDCAAAGDPQQTPAAPASASASASASTARAAADQ